MNQPRKAPFTAQPVPGASPIVDRSPIIIAKERTTGPLSVVGKLHAIQAPSADLLDL
jgi:hypothetical protein